VSPLFFSCQQYDQATFKIPQLLAEFRGLHKLLILILY